MKQGLQPLLDRCAQGFTRPKKIFLTMAGLLWIVSPFDFDFVPLLGWIDDALVIRLLFALWRGPTLPWPPPGTGTAVKEAGVSAIRRLARRIAAEART